MSLLRWSVKFDSSQETNVESDEKHEFRQLILECLKYQTFIQYLDLTCIQNANKHR